MDQYVILITVIIIVILLIVVILVSDKEEDKMLESDFSLSTNLDEAKKLANQYFNNVQIKDRLHGSNNLGMYNLSVHKYKDGYQGVIRCSSSNGCALFPPGPLFSYVYHINLDNSGKVSNTNLLNLDYNNMVGCSGELGFESNGVEDPKLFIYKGEQWVIANIRGSKNQPNYCKNAMCIFNIKYPRETFKILEVPLNVNPNQIQKNWSLFEHEGDLLCEYSISPHVILSIDPNLGITTELYRSGKNGQNVVNCGSLRGGGNSIKTIIKNKEYYLNIGHTTNGLIRNYKHFFYIFESKPPFEILGISEPSKLDTNSLIQFAAGISEYENNIYVSYGISDCYNRISVFSKDKITSLFPKIFLK